MKQNKKKKNKQGKNGRLTRFIAEILQTDKFWTEMILAGNQRKQRGPLHIKLKNQDGVRQRQSFLVKYVSFCMIVIQTLVPV